MIKTAIVGLGRLGVRYAENIAYNTPNAQLIAACSLKPEEIDHAKKTLKIPHTYHDYEEMLHNKDIEAVFVLSSTAEHPIHIIKALKAGKHVFCEKPLSTCYKSCLEVERLAEQCREQIAMIGFVRRFDESYFDAKNKLDQGLVGAPIMVKSQTVDMDTGAQFQVEFAAASGGIFNDYNIHDVDLARWYLKSEIKRVWALGGAYRFKEFGEFQDADNAAALCELENGAIAFIGGSRIASFGHDTRAEIICTHGNLQISDPPTKNRLRISDKRGVRYECVETFYERFEKAFQRQIRYFCHCVENNIQPELTVASARKNTLVAKALTASFRSGEPIKVGDFEKELIKSENQRCETLKSVT